MVALDFGWAGLPAVITEIALRIGMELTARVIEEPFGWEGDDLPLDGYCQGIARFVETR